MVCASLFPLLLFFSSWEVRKKMTRRKLLYIKEKWKCPCLKKIFYLKIKKWVKARECDIVSLIFYFLVKLHSDGKEWKHAHSKSSKGTCQLSSGLSGMSSPLRSYAGYHSTCGFPMTHSAPPGPLFFFELKLISPILKLLAFFRSRWCFIEISIFIPYKLNNSYN